MDLRETVNYWCSLSEKDLRKIVQRWTEDNIVKPVSGRVNIVTLACSDKSIPEIKERLEELRKAVEADPEFWEYYLPGFIKRGVEKVNE